MKLRSLRIFYPDLSVFGAVSDHKIAALVQESAEKSSLLTSTSKENQQQNPTITELRWVGVWFLGVLSSAISAVVTRDDSQLRRRKRFRNCNSWPEIMSFEQFWSTWTFVNFGSENLELKSGCIRMSVSGAKPVTFGSARLRLFEVFQQPWCAWIMKNANNRPKHRWFLS